MEKSNIPEPTWVFATELVFCISCICSGSFILYRAFSDLLGKDEFISVLIACIIFIILGIVLLFKIINQIKLRLNWNKANDIQIKEIKVSSKEANKYEYLTNNPTYHSELLEKISGTQSKLKSDKYGNTWLNTESHSSIDDGILYLLLIPILISIVGVTLFMIVLVIKRKNYLFIPCIIMFIIIDVIIIKEAIHFINMKILTIKEKKKEKE